MMSRVRLCRDIDRTYVLRIYLLTNMLRELSVQSRAFIFTKQIFIFTIISTYIEANTLYNLENINDRI